MKPKELLRLLKHNGWRVLRQNGTSHCVLVKDGKRVIVPVHNAEMSKGLCESILKDAGLK